MLYRFLIATLQTNVLEAVTLLVSSVILAKRVYQSNWFRGQKTAIYVSGPAWRTASGSSVLGASYVQPQTDKPREMFVYVRTFGELSARHVLRVFGWSEVKYLLEWRICTFVDRCSWFGRFEVERKIVFYFFWSCKNCFRMIVSMMDGQLLFLSLSQWSCSNNGHGTIVLCTFAICPFFLKL